MIGKTPPPVGGVTVHVSRLIEHMQKCHIPHRYYYLSAFSLIHVIVCEPPSSILHLVSSNPLVRLFFSALTRVLRRTTVLTFTGSLDRYNDLRDILDKLAIRFCSIAIVANYHSEKIARRLNNRIEKQSMFIPPLKEEKLSHDHIMRIAEFSKQFSNRLCVTSAWALSFDSCGREIYGVRDLIELFTDETLCNTGLLVSDPSGTVLSWVKSKCRITPNILFINGNHPLIPLIRRSKILIRNTTTDGDSVAVREALWVNRAVLATDIVDRPPGVKLYKCGDHKVLRELILESFSVPSPGDQHQATQSTIPDSISLYRRLLA